MLKFRTILIGELNFMPFSYNPFVNITRQFNQPLKERFYYALQFFGGNAVMLSDNNKIVVDIGIFDYFTGYIPYAVSLALEYLASKKNKGLIGGFFIGLLLLITTSLWLVRFCIFSSCDIFDHPHYYAYSCCFFTMFIK